MDAIVMGILHVLGPTHLLISSLNSGYKHVNLCIFCLEAASCREEAHVFYRPQNPASFSSSDAVSSSLNCAASTSYWSVISQRITKAEDGRGQVDKHNIRSGVCTPSDRHEVGDDYRSWMSILQEGRG